MNLLPNFQLKTLKSAWAEPDSQPGRTWTYDGIPEYPGHWMSYSFEMQEALSVFASKSFDELVLWLTSVLSFKPDVIDLMGGAYFLESPENTNTLTGVRIHDKDLDFLKVFGSGSPLSQRTNHIISASNRKVIEANLLETQGWQKVQTSTPKVHLLVCRPVGILDGQHATVTQFDDPKDYCKLYRWLFHNMTKLTYHSSVIFTELPDIYNKKQIKKFFADYDKRSGSKTTIFVATGEDYHRNGLTRRYVVILNGKFANMVF